MFISFKYKDSKTSKSILATIFFERTSLLYKFEEDDEKKKTRITEVVLKIDNLNDKRLSTDFTYLKMSWRDYNIMISELGISQYGEWQNHSTLKYKELEFADGVFAEETITIPDYVDDTLA